MADDFFQRLPPVTQFAEIASEKHYAPAPDDWHVVVTDVTNSTEAVDSGNYRKVNIAGAAAIAAMRNLCKGTEIPYAFGGDGCSVLIPPSFAAKAREELMKTRSLTQAAFGLGLRVGMVEVGRLRREKKAEVRVARYELQKGVSLAAFSGGGVRAAEDMLKDGSCEIKEALPGSPDTSGLSCRWEPLRPRRGRMLSLLVLARKGKEEVYGEVLARISRLMEPKPIGRENLRFKWPPRGLLMEARMGKGWLPLKLLRLIGFTALVYWLTKRGKKAGDYDPQQYQQDVVANADYRKFDDMLRMVLDVSAEDIRTIREYLEGLYTEGRIYFGLHEADHALMTCLVSSLASDGHVHFIDGGDGGYAFAAREMKRQMKAKG